MIVFVLLTSKSTRLINVILILNCTSKNYFAQYYTDIQGIYLS